MSADDYESRMAAWKARHGIATTDAETVDQEAIMVAEDAKRPGKDYCVLCGEQFRIADMRLITRRDDPYIQCDEEAPSESRPWYIQVQHRCRACKPCYKRDYEDYE